MEGELEKKNPSSPSIKYYFRSTFNIYELFEILTIQRAIRYKENGYAEKVQQVTLAPELLRYDIIVMCYVHNLN